MSRMTRDPTTDEMPDFGSDEYRAFLQPLVTEDNPIDAVVQNAKDIWQEAHRKKVEAWDRQTAEDAEQERLLQEERDREEEEARRAREQKKQQEREDREKKKPKVKAFVPNKKVRTVATKRLAPYAENKLKAAEWYELWYHTEAGSADAADADRSVSQSAVTFTYDSGQMQLAPAAAHKPSTKAVPDARLSWRDMDMGATDMVERMDREPNWPREHVEALGAFFMELRAHRLRREQFGEQALVQYAAEVRKDWMDEVRSDQEDVEPFDIAVINEERLNDVYRAILNRQQVLGMERSVAVNR